MPTRKPFPMGRWICSTQDKIRRYRFAPVTVCAFVCACALSGLAALYVCMLFFGKRQNNNFLLLSLFRFRKRGRTATAWCGRRQSEAVYTKRFGCSVLMPMVKAMAKSNQLNCYILYFTPFTSVYAPCAVRVCSCVFVARISMWRNLNFNFHSITIKTLSGDIKIIQCLCWFCDQIEEREEPLLREKESFITDFFDIDCAELSNYPNITFQRNNVHAVTVTAY